MSSDKARELEEFLAEWKRRHESEKAIAPEVQREHDAAKWLIKAAELIESQAPQEVQIPISRRISIHVDELKRRMPLPPLYITQSESAYLIATSTSSADLGTHVFEVLTSMVSSPGGADVLPVAEEYQHLQEAQGRIVETRLRLLAVFPSLVQLFESAHRAHEIAKLSPNEVPSVAGEIRTLLDKFKGELFSKAVSHSHENMTWQTMSERLSDEGSSERRMLLEQEDQRRQPYTELSEILKQRTPSDVTRLSSAWALVVDHIFVVCGCLLARL